MRAFLLRLLSGLTLLLLLSPAARAQPSPADKAQFQRRLRAIHYGYRYWDAPFDSLQRVLAGQHVDSLRLQTLEHVLDVPTVTVSQQRAYEAAGQEAAVLAARLHYPERVPLRLAAYYWSNVANSKNQAALLDTLRTALTYYDALGPKPQTRLLAAISSGYRGLNQPEAKRVFFQRQLAYYQPHGAAENVAYCHRGLGGYYLSRGDYNQAISHELRAVELFRTVSKYMYYNEMRVIGANYAAWGNGARALHYLQQGANWSGTPPSSERYVTRTIASIYLQQGRYPLALRYATQALRPRTPADTVSAADRAAGLVQQSAVLLALGRQGEVPALLQYAQHLVDSLRLPLFSSVGDCELNATWARYYTATGATSRAEAAWQAAYRQARQEHRTPLRLAYLQALALFYQQRGQPARSNPYALAALALTDTLNTAQATTHVAQYEIEQADRAQQARIAALRETQLLDAARARRQRYVLGAVLVLLALIGGFSFLLWRGNRRQQQANAALNRLNQAVTAQKQELQNQRDQLDTSLTELRATQTQLIQKEKMASLGELTAGIAHEIQNPLNFVNNFSEVSSELLTELAEEQARPERDAGLEAELVSDLRQNLSKITQHGQRAAGIVKGMLEHSSSAAGEREPTDLNRLCDEYLRLAYQGLRAKDKSFNATLNTDFLADLPRVTLVGADVGRVLLNLFTNAFYAVRQRQQQGEPGYQPQVGVRTVLLNQQVQIQVTDNGTGMSPAVQQKIFQPFFTTKPTGEGTGLGLSLSHDIIAQGHGGSLAVESQEGQGTAFTITLPC
ncbi:ATP-binding protein [Hymenobacter sp. BT770]|uniref:ATP-binding protein n=1 Tax=Hymenobacter sp. BT770 TaxID=2886942 RepID=UPI001D1293DB|nr:ATP-binding protein [Hymenobacter sp. BT770]MCC3154593.1 histidine kinase [Hymenobacter sp. BT770]MDO3416647.1 ATP-binding protein [Hymenobacter sp. BT770]